MGGGREGGHASRAAVAAGGKSRSPPDKFKERKGIKNKKHQPDTLFKERQSSGANARMAARSEEVID